MLERFAKTLAKPNLDSPSNVLIAVCVVGLSSYLAARVGGVLVVRPQMIWPVWPGCAFLVAVLLLAPRRFWPALLAAGLTGFVVYDLRAGVAFRSIAWLILADTVEIMTAALGARYVLGARLRIDTLKSLAHYSIFAVILAPLLAAFFGAEAFRGLFGARCRIAFLTESLALLTLTPAILSWAHVLRTRPAKSYRYFLEIVLLISGLTIAGNLAFMTSERTIHPALLYSLVPFLLWAALRFGVLGVSTSMIAVAFLSIWGAVHGHGPFHGVSPFDTVSTLQLFLLFAAVSFMVLAVLVEERKLAGASVRESEERYRRIVETTNEGVWLLDSTLHNVYVNRHLAEMLGYEPGEMIGQSVFDFCFPEDLNHVKQILERRPQGYREVTDERLRRRDGAELWVRLAGTLLFKDNGEFDGALAMVEDITERKRAEKALSGMTRKLIEAQEQERTRIGRELHDDINQRLALLAIGLERMKERLPASAVQREEDIAELQTQAVDLSEDIQALSHRLHSSKLELLGLSAAAGSLCREFSDRQKLEIDFQSSGIPKDLPGDISICLYRVLQEGLQNAIKHSGSRQMRVVLAGDANGVELTVQDSGVGFEPEDAIRGRGVGLLSMKERLKLLGGQLFIDSQLQRGTAIRAHVPLKRASKAAGTG